MSNKKVDEVKPTPPSNDPSPSTDAGAISDCISRYDEMSKRRLESMNQKLKELEVQMESFEAEMRKASEASMLDHYCSDHRTTYAATPPPNFPFM